jgi:predicted  nucleic acid-binding Zn-ribbon protein
VDSLNTRIRELDYELKQQKDQYMRKSSTKAVPQTDPELEKMRSFIRQLEEEISDLRR